MSRGRGLTALIGAVLVAAALPAGTGATLGDDNFIAYGQRQTDGTLDLVVSDGDGGGFFKITNTPGVTEFPTAWVGSRIYYTRFTGTDVNVFAFDAVRGTTAQLTFGPGEHAFPTGPCAMDGSALAVQVGISNPSVARLDLDSLAVSGPRAGHSPTCSPNGATVAYIGVRKGDEALITFGAFSGADVVVPIASSFGATSLRQPEFVDEGRSILLSALIGGRYSILRVNLATGGSALVAQPPPGLDYLYPTSVGGAPTFTQYERATGTASIVYLDLVTGGVKPAFPGAEGPAPQRPAVCDTIVSGENVDVIFTGTAADDASAATAVIEKLEGEDPLLPTTVQPCTGYERLGPFFGQTTRLVNFHLESGWDVLRDYELPGGPGTHVTVDGGLGNDLTRPMLTPGPGRPVPGLVGAPPGPGRLTLLGGAGDDVLDTSKVSPGRRIVLNGGPGADLIVGGAEGERIVGGTGRDTVKAGAGDDTIRVRDGTPDVVDAGRGRDTVIADRFDTVKGAETVKRR